MMSRDLTNWLITEQPIIEQIILDAAQAYCADHENLPNFGFDFRSSQIEAYNLIDGQDLCYDRYTTPLAYSLWYQAKRINVFLSHFSSQILEAFDTSYPVDVFDLGAGTGCVQMCFGLVYIFQRRRYNRYSIFRLINVDLSPFMLEYLRSYLWPAAIRQYPELKGIPVEYHVYSWSNKGDIQVANPWICASYLFDSTDNEEYLISNFEELIKSFDPSKIFLLTSSQRQKLNLLNRLSQKLGAGRYKSFPSASSNYIFDGVLSKVEAFRNLLIEKYNLKASKYPVSWRERGFTAVGLETVQKSLFLASQPVPQNLELFSPPLRIRRDVNLNLEQQAAAQFEERPSIIIGPAGCGKSIVITEKIINILEHYQWLKNLNILVTTFNKGLIQQLRNWISDLLDAREIKYRQLYYLKINGVDNGTGEIQIGEPATIIIKFVHFEMLGKYFGGLKHEPFDKELHKNYLTSACTSVRAQLSIPADEMNDILNPDFLLEEYHRVIYGLGCKLSMGEKKYQEIERKGRGRKPQLQFNSPRRNAIWRVLYNYGRWMHEDRQAGKSFIARRQLFLNELEKETNQHKFDYIFVDEFQDCTAADYKIMTLMLKNVDNLVLAGDLAQSVHIGQSGTIPRDDDMSRRKYHRLKGSYRLPYRISEAVAPVSRFITNNSGDKDVTAEITPYKGAPPGARPIVVYADDDKLLAGKISLIKRCYSAFQLQCFTVLEKDNTLRNALWELNEEAETSTILKLKGLERGLIVWSLQAQVSFENEVNEFAYTIMTRTNCLLIIAITSQHQIPWLEVVQKLRVDRLIYWDDETINFLALLKQPEVGMDN